MRVFLVLLFCALPGLAGAQSRAEVADGVDRFVLELLDRLQPKSVAENRAYCGLVGFDAEARLVATPARAGTAADCDAGAAPGGWEVIASYTTRGAFLGDAESEVPAAADLAGAIGKRLDVYMATPGGRVWLNLAMESLTYQVCGRGCVAADPKARPCKSFTPTIQYTLDELRTREKKPVKGC